MLVRLLLLLLLALAAGPHARAAEPVRVGLDAEFGLRNSTSAQAIERGIRVAMAEINSAGGVLGGRPLELVVRDNRSVPARAIENLGELAAMPDMVAVFCGRFSPSVIEALPMIHERRLVVLDPWAAADQITEHGFTPSYTFRLALRDSLAMPAMLAHAAARGAGKVGLLLVNTGWGRSNLAAAERALAERGRPFLTGVAWYNYGDRSLLRQYRELRLKGAEAVVVVANDIEGATLVREVAALPPAERLPLVAHWGVTGGRLVEAAGPALFEVDFSVVQSFSFLKADRARVERFLAGWRRLYGPTRPQDIVSPVGVAHAYDLTHILARAIELAGTTDRAAVRDALERVRDYRGLAHDFPRPFSPARHDALDPADVFMARYRPDGTVEPLGGATP